MDKLYKIIGIANNIIVWSMFLFISITFWYVLIRFAWGY